MSGTAQLALDFEQPGSRRIDITLGRLDDQFASRLDEVSHTKWFGILLIISQLRGMEMAEATLGPGRETLADAYDEIVAPGEPAIPALLRVFAHCFQGRQP